MSKPVKDKYDVWFDTLALTIPLVTGGDITISKKHIKITGTEADIDVPLSEIQQLSFTNGGFNDEVYLTSAYDSLSSSSYSGIENYIFFIWKNERYLFQSYIRSEDQQYFLVRWIQRLKKNGVNAAIINKTVNELPGESTGGLRFLKILAIIVLLLAFSIWEYHENKNHNLSPELKTDTHLHDHYIHLMQSAKIFSITPDSGNCVFSFSVPDSLSGDTLAMRMYVHTMKTDKELVRILNALKKKLDDSLGTNGKIIINMCRKNNKNDIIKKY